MAGAKQNDFIDEFKAVYKEKGKFDLKAQIPYLSKLGDRYKRRGKKGPKKRWSDLLKVNIHSLLEDHNNGLTSSFSVKLSFQKRLRIRLPVLAFLCFLIHLNQTDAGFMFLSRLTPYITPVL